jgi:TonB family protein
MGTASVQVNLSATGAVLSATIAKSTGNAALDQAALLAAKQSTYKPEIKDCVPVAGAYLYRVDFANQ